MDIENLTIKQVREIASMVKGEKCSGTSRDFTIGEIVLIRTVTFYWIGKVTKETDEFVYLDPASCVYDTGRFNDALAKGTLNEVEPGVGEVRVGKGAIVDVSTWKHVVPMTQK